MNCTVEDPVMNWKWKFSTHKKEVS